MALSKTQVSQLYVSLFGRASEGDGNTYWQTAPASTGMDVAADTMLGTDAAIAYFGPTLDDNQKFIEHIYLNTLGKTYAQDPEGVDFWVNELNSGKSKGEVVAALVLAAQDPGNAGPAQDQFNNKVVVSDYSADTIAEYSVAIPFSDFIAGVTDDPATVSTAKESVDEAANPDHTTGLTLTKEKDLIVGTDGNDQILGRYDTYNTVDIIDGGKGTDTLSLDLFGAETDTVQVTAVENIVVRNADELTNIGAGSWTGAVLLTFANSTAKTGVSNLKEELTIALDNNNQPVRVSYADDALGSAESTQNLSVDNSTAAVSLIAGGTDKINALNISATNTNIISLEENDIVTINISGSGNLELLSSVQESGILGQVSTVLASTATGNLILDLSAVDLTVSSEYFVKVVSGFGNDVITASKNDNQINAGSGDDYVIVKSDLDKKDLLEGGDGTDVLSITSADFIATASDSQVLSAINGFEYIGILDELSAGAAVDISVYGVNGIVIGAGIAGDQELTGFFSGATIEIQTDASETDVLTVTMPDATKVGSNFDSLNIIFKADLEAADDIYETAFDVKGINFISVTTADATTAGETSDDGTLPDASDGYQLLLSNDGNLNAILVGGDHAFNFVTTETSPVRNITAKDMKGNMLLDFNTAFGGTQGVSLTTGGGNDSITGSVYGDLILAGAGNDIINITAGADRITGGADADTFVIGEIDLTTQTAYTSILDFSAVTEKTMADKITNIASTITQDIAGVDVSAAEVSGGSGMIITADVADGIVTISGTDAERINTFGEWLALAYLACESSKTIGFEFEGNTYVVEESSSGSAIGSLVELVGVTSIVALAGIAGENTILISA
jgi:uncharacterized protein DUF4214/hemolysin type calcium-binding protein